MRGAGVVKPFASAYGGQGILELDNFRANLELYIYRIFI